MKQLLCLFGFSLTFLAANAYAEWTIDGNVVSNADDLQMNPAVAPDGSKGALIAWQDRRDGTSFDVYVQKVDAAGIAQWTSNGVLICGEVADQTDPKVISDGAGGAIVVWEDTRTTIEFDVYIQRVDQDGVPMWAENGVPVTLLPTFQQNPVVVTDDNGGAIVVWQDNRDGTHDIYAQRYDGTGAALWAEDGVVLCGAIRTQQNPLAIADGTGGVIATWIDRRAGLGDIYVQHAGGDGIVTWTANGVPVCTDPEDQTTPVLASDEIGGVHVVWADSRSGGWDIYTQQLDASGNVLHAVNGVPLCTALGDQTNPTIVPIGIVGPATGAVGGDAIAAWEDRRAGNADIYASRMSGDQVWGTDGIPLCVAPLDQTKPSAASDGASGAIVAWQDGRPNFHHDIYAQRVSALGATLWDANGIQLCAALGDQFDPVAAPSDLGTAIVAWEDLRNGGVYDIYAQQAGDPPTAVAIAHFEVAWDGESVSLSAAFRSDLKIQAVNVYRGDGAAPMQRLDAVATTMSPFAYVDRGVVAGESYRYQIGVVDGDGEFFSPEVTISTVPLPTSLEQNQPNPFNPSTSIHFVTSAPMHATLTVYDASGHRVRVLVDKQVRAGRHEVEWDGRDDHGLAQSSGVYFYRLQAGKHVEARKMVLLK